MCNLKSTSEMRGTFFSLNYFVAGETETSGDVTLS